MFLNLWFFIFAIRCSPYVLFYLCKVSFISSNYYVQLDIVRSSNYFSLFFQMLFWEKWSIIDCAFILEFEACMAFKMLLYQVFSRIHQCSLSYGTESVGGDIEKPITRYKECYVVVCIGIVMLSQRSDMITVHLKAFGIHSSVLVHLILLVFCSN